eukprot:gene5561-9563_t
MTTESTNDDQLKRLIQIRRGNRSVVTKLENEVSSIISRISASEASSNSATKANLLARVESISTSLKQKHQYITELNEQIINKIDTPLIDKEIDETSEWDATVFEVINKIEQIKLGSYTRDPQPPGIPIGQIESNTQQEEQDRNRSLQKVIISDLEAGQEKKSADTKEITESLREFWRHESLGLPEIVQNETETPDECSAAVESK